MVKVIEIRVNGGIEEDMYPDVGLDGERIFKEKKRGIYHPVQKVWYKDRELVYGICDINEPGPWNGFISVHGYKASEPYMKKINAEYEFGERAGDERIVRCNKEDLVMKVELIDPKDKEEIRSRIRKVTANNEWAVNILTEDLMIASEEVIKKLFSRKKEKKGKEDL